MSDFKGHTPGPWHIDEESEGIFNRRCLYVCDVPVSAENAHLIAAAPDLLEALIGADLQLEWAAKAIEAGRYDEALMHCSAMSRRRKSAIAKAKGDANAPDSE